MKGVRLCKGFFVLSLLGILLTAGCVKIDSTLDLAENGSGTWRVVYAMPLHMIRQMEFSQGISRDIQSATPSGGAALVDRMQDIPYLFEEEAIRRRFKMLSVQGIVLDKVQTRSSGGWRHVDMTVRFTKLENLFRQPFMDGLGVAVSGAGTGSCKLSISLPEMGQAETLPNPEDSAVSAKISPFMNGLRIISRIGVPGDIRNSTSLTSDGRRATWEWDYDKDARALPRLARDRMIVVFDGSGSTLRDFTKPALRE